MGVKQSSLSKLLFPSQSWSSNEARLLLRELCQRTSVSVNEEEKGSRSVSSSFCLLGLLMIFFVLSKSHEEVLRNGVTAEVTTV